MNSMLRLPFLTKALESEGWQVRADCSSVAGVHSVLAGSPCPVALGQGNVPLELSELL